MPIVYGADIRQEDLDTAQTPVLNVVGQYPTVGAGCYPIPWFNAGPQVNPVPQPTFWLARPRQVTAAPLNPFPVVNISAPPGWNGVSISQANTPFVYGVSGPPVPFPQGQALPDQLTAQQAIKVINDVANGDWDTALTRVGVQEQPIDLHRDLPISQPIVPEPNKIFILLSTPHIPGNLCSRFAARLVHMLSGFDPRFESDPSVYVVSGTPVIQHKVKLQPSDVVSLRDAAIIMGLMMSGIDPALYRSAMKSRVLNSIADKALYDSLVTRDITKQGMTVGRLADGSIAATVGLDLGSILGTVTDIAGAFAGIGGPVGDVASVVATAANPVSSLVNSIASGNVSDIASAANEALPALGVAANAMGATDVANVAKVAQKAAKNTTQKAKNAVELVKQLSKRADVSPTQLGSAIQNAAKKIITEQSPVTQQLVQSITSEEAGQLVSQVSSLKREKAKQSRSRPSTAYSSAAVNEVIDNLEFLSNDPGELLLYLERALGTKIARKDALRSLYRVLRQRLDEVNEAKTPYQPTFFQDEERVMKAIKAKLLKLKNRKKARALLEYLISAIEQHYYG